MDVRTFYIDIGLAGGGFTLVHDDRVVGSMTMTDHKDEAGLMPAVETLLSDAGWTMRDLTHIAAVTGPGGFMTIRVAMSMANAMAYALQIPIAGIHASDLWHARVAASYQLPATSFIWLHSTKKAHIFVRGFGKYEQQWPEATLVGIEELRTLPSGTLWAGELIPEHVAALPQCKQATLRTSAAVLLPQLLQTLSYGKQTLLPWYGRGA